MRFRNGMRRFFGDSLGQDLIEYVLLSSFVAILLLGAAYLLGANLNGWYDQMSSFVATASGGDSGEGGSGGNNGGGNGGGGSGGGNGENGGGSGGSGGAGGNGNGNGSIGK